MAAAVIREKKSYREETRGGKTEEGELYLHCADGNNRQTDRDHQGKVV